MQAWHRIKKWFRNPGFLKGEKREHLYAALLLLGILASLPEPFNSELNSANLLIVGVWFVVGLAAAIVYFNPSMIGPLWFLAFAFCLLAFLKLKLLYPLAMIILWGLWFWFRSGRDKGGTRQ